VILDVLEFDFGDSQGRKLSGGQWAVGSGQWDYHCPLPTIHYPLPTAH
jgi:hypothetical protein